MITKITKEKFCKETHTNPECWVFYQPGPGEEFSMNVADDGSVEYFYNDGKGTIRAFKDMPEYKEVWAAVRQVDNGNRWSIWNRWSSYDE